MGFPLPQLQAARCAGVVACGLMLLVAVAGDARAQTLVPVRGGTVVVPNFYAERYHDSDSCQASLNAALHSLSEQLGNIPFPPPGEPGYHEWANAIGAEMSRINAQRSVCLGMGARGRTAPREEAQRFAGAAERHAKAIVRVREMIKESRGKPARKGRLAGLVLDRAGLLGGRFDLEALKNPQTWSRSNKLGTDLRKGQLKQLPGFAKDLQEVADYEHDIVTITEERAKSDQELAFRMNLLAQQQFEGRRYDQLYPDEKRKIVSQVQRESGALQNLIRRALGAAQSGLGVIFGR
jgi:hypothetical protein